MELHDRVETTYKTSFPLDCFVFISLQLSKTPDGLYKCSAKVICHALRDLVPFLQFKKRKNTHGEHPPWVFSTFLNCTNGTKLRKTSHILFPEILKIKWFVINFNIFIKRQKLRSETAWSR